MPSPVDRYFKEIKDENPSYSDEQAWATAWSIYCKHKNPGSDHCKKPTSEYLKGKNAMTLLRDFQDAVIVRNVVARFNASEDEGADPVTEFLKDNVKMISELSHGMSAEAKKGGAGQFGMRDVRDALNDWFKGGDEPKSDKGKASWTYLKSDKGTKVFTKLTKGIMKALKDAGKKTGYKDVGEALIKFMT